MPNLPPLPLNRRVDRSKIENYLLHPINGRGKSAFFEAYGCCWRGGTYCTAHRSDAVVSPYGTRYIVRGALRTPDGRKPQPVVCSVWQADDREGVR